MRFCWKQGHAKIVSNLRTFRNYNKYKRSSQASSIKKEKKKRNRERERQRKRRRKGMWERRQEKRERKKWVYLCMVGKNGEGKRKKNNGVGKKIIVFICLLGAKCRL